MKKLIIITIISVLFSCSTQRKVICTDGEIVFVSKHPEKPYAPIIKSFNTNIKTTIEMLDKIKFTNLDVSIKPEITKINETLNQFGSQQSNILMTQIISSNKYPCDKTARRKTEKLVLKLANDNAVLEKIRLLTKDSLDIRKIKILVDKLKLQY